MTLPKDRESREGFPIATGCVAYFPDALAWVAKCSLAGNKQHSPGQPLKWRRDVSADHPNKLMRHLSDHLTADPVDSDGIPHIVKVAWRALAEAQLFLEAEQKKAEKRESAVAIVARVNAGARPAWCDHIYSDLTDRGVQCSLCGGLRRELMGERLCKDCGQDVTESGECGCNPDT